MRLIAFFVYGWLGIALAFGPAAANAKILQDTIEVPVQVVDAHGRNVKHSIKVATFHDDVRANAPFLILNHGRAGRPNQRAEMKIERYFQNAHYFVSRGFAVFIPTRIGYGLTGGPDVEDSGGDCRSKNYPPVYEAAARQSIAVIAYAKARPHVDPNKGIVMGQSFGGATAIALAAKKVPGVMAAVNFAGGGGGNPERRPQQPCGADRLGALFASYGATAKILTLWLYSENDQFWGPTLPR